MSNYYEDVIGTGSPYSTSEGYFSSEGKVADKEDIRRDQEAAQRRAREAEKRIRERQRQIADQQKRAQEQFSRDARDVYKPSSNRGTSSMSSGYIDSSGRQVSSTEDIMSAVEQNRVNQLTQK